MILPWAHRLISAGAHGLRRIPGQSVNLAHLIWRIPRAPAPLPSGNNVYPRRFSARGHSRCLTPSVRFAASFPVNGEAACHNCFRVPLPHSWGSSGEAGEGVFPPRTPLPQAMPPQKPLTSLGAQDGASRGEIGYADARSAPLDTPACALRIVGRL